MKKMLSYGLKIKGSTMIVNTLLQIKKPEIKDLGKVSLLTLGWGTDYIDSPGASKPSAIQD